MLKKIIKIVLTASTLALMFCNSNNQQTLSSGYVENQTLALSFALPCADGNTGDTLVRATAVVSGGDIDTIIQELQVEPCKITGLVKNIYKGEKRKVDINVYNKKNQIVYTGSSSFFDVIPGKSIDVVIKLQSQKGNINITGIICDEEQPVNEFTPDNHTLALYHFNEDTGAIIYDAMEKWNGILFGGKRVAGYSGKAVKFEYGDSAIFDTIIPDKTPAGTIELFFKFDDSPKKDSVYLLFGNEGSRCNIYYKNDTLVFMKNHSDIFRSVAFAAIHYQNNWYHVAGTWGTKGMRLFINNSLVAANNDFSCYESSPRSTNENFYKIGNKTYCCMNGGDMEVERPVSVEAIIDEVRISDIERY